MSIEKNFDYEYFVRKVFNDADRWQDPLGLANTDVNNRAKESRDLWELRLGVAYSVRRIQKRLETEAGETGDVYHRLDSYVSELMSSSVTYRRIHQIITEAESVFDSRLKN